MKQSTAKSIRVSYYSNLVRSSHRQIIVKPRRIITFNTLYGRVINEPPYPAKYFIWSPPYHKNPYDPSRPTVTEHESMNKMTKVLPTSKMRHTLTLSPYNNHREHVLPDPKRTIESILPVGDRCHLPQLL